MSNKFCRLLSNGYKINVENNELLWSPCCFYSKKTPLLDTLKFNQAHKYASSATDWLPECATCRQMESTGVNRLSPRLVSFSKVPEDTTNGDCVALELSFDTKCNAACLSCGVYCSTTWGKYNQKHNINKFGPTNKSADYFLKQLIEQVDLTKLRDIFILGGEPFYSDSHINLLNYLHEHHPALDKVTLRYQTNGSITPNSKVIALWNLFKLVEIGLSVDGVGDRFNYLRWPLKWHRVESTVRNLLNLTNVNFNINATISPLNILYFQDIEDWAYSIIPKERFRLPDAPVRPNRCFDPLNLNLTNVSLRQAVISKYGIEHRLNKVLAVLEFNPNYSKMFDYINQHDQIRKLNWRTTFPDTLEHYAHY